MAETCVRTPVELAATIEQICDKLRERGMIVSLCGDEEAECEFVFLRRDGEGVYLQLKVSTMEDVSVKEDAAERVSDFVSAKICDIFDRVSFDVEGEFIGVEVVVNNFVAY